MKQEIMENQPVTEEKVKKRGTKKALKAVILLLAILLPVLLTAAATFILPPQYDNTYYGGLAVKDQTLALTTGPKIVVVGGSSVPFGLDSATLSAYMGMPVVDFGLYLALGTNIMLDLSRDSIGEGDIVILSPEQHQQALSMYFNASETWKALDSDMSMLTEIAEDDRQKLAGNWWDYVTSKVKYSINGKPDPQSVYRKDSLNAYGDISYPRPENIMEKKYDPSTPVDMSGGAWTQEFIDYLNEYIAYAESKGATVYFSCCPVNKMAVVRQTVTAYDADTDEDVEVKVPLEDTLSDYYAFLCKNINCRIISSPADYVLPSGYFYDTNFHLNDLGVPLRTKLLIEDLYRERGIVKAVDITVADVPDDVDSGDEGSEVTDDNFIYKNQLGSLTVTGVTEVGKTKTYLTIPSEVEGVAVTTIAENAFADCKSLVTLRIPTSVNYIFERAFNGCSSLKSIYFDFKEGEVPGTGAHMLEGCNSGVTLYYISSEIVDKFKFDYTWGEYFGDKMKVGTAPADDGTSATPGASTETPSGDQKSCGGITVAAQFIAVMCGVIGFAVIKKTKV